MGGRGYAGQSGVKGGKWDDCNSIINKIYLKIIKNKNALKSKVYFKKIKEKMSEYNLCHLWVGALIAYTKFAISSPFSI